MSPEAAFLIVSKLEADNFIDSRSAFFGVISDFEFVSMVTESGN